MDAGKVGHFALVILLIAALGFVVTRYYKMTYILLTTAGAVLDKL